MSDHPHKFLTLDALRGVAAIVVLQFHTFGYFGGSRLRHGYLAVDFFFLLSGFVLSLAYQQRLDVGWSVGSFLKVRLIRLYPLYALGLLLGIADALIESRYAVAPSALAAYSVLLVLGALLLPTPLYFPGSYGAAFPFNYPSWSLFLEILANLVHALALRRRSWMFLLAVVLGSGAMLVYSEHTLGGLDFGLAAKHIFYAVPRVLFSYVLGMLLFQFWKRRTTRFRVSPLITTLLLLMILGAPQRAHLPASYDLFAVAFLFPMVLLMGASANPHPRLVKPAMLLGQASYAIYVLHAPLQFLLGVLWGRLRGRSMESDAPWSGLLYLALVVLLSLLLDRFYDAPVRSFLRRRFRGNGSATARTT